MILALTTACQNDTAIWQNRSSPCLLLMHRSIRAAKAGMLRGSFAQCSFIKSLAHRHTRSPNMEIGRRIFLLFVSYLIFSGSLLTLLKSIFKYWFYPPLQIFSRSPLPHTPFSLFSFCSKSGSLHSRHANYTRRWTLDVVPSTMCSTRRTLLSLWHLELSCIEFVMEKEI